MSALKGKTCARCGHWYGLHRNNDEACPLSFDTIGEPISWSEGLYFKAKPDIRDYDFEDLKYLKTGNEDLRAAARAAARAEQNKKIESMLRAEFARQARKAAK